ncbi:hypothetical protein NQ317_019272 [Molorchus minor]|uniref:MIF4G domain-containing protein n=1 Tax=Molorchus minor TaxID=1323400 RepID=A0ABQ9JVY6_9CUCU|nr:hypothetical protein NQ317_019272 [Molorchus minor]
MQVDTYLKDMLALNLSKYISEIAAAIVESKLKMNDVPAAVKLCTVLHQTYAEFSQHLFENWQKALAVKVGEKILNPSKLRVDLRFYAELVQAGIFANKNAFSLLGSVLTTLINMDKEEHYNIAIILSFSKHCGDDFAGLVPREMRKLSSKYDMEIPKSTFLPPEKQQNVRSLLRDYYISLSKHLERKDKLEQLQSAYDKLLTNTKQFSEILDEDMPALKTQSLPKSEETMIVTGSGPDLEDGSANVENIWCDVETQRFYCDLPELTVFLPTAFLNKGQTPPPTETVTEEVLDSELPVEDLDDDSKSEDAPPPEEETDDSSSITASNKVVLEAFLNNLPNCVNREMIDNAAIDFLVTLNNKHNRKKLVRALFGVNRTRLDLLPFYARFVAILHPALPEVGNELCQMLRQDFKYHVRKKDQINIESKIKVVSPDSHQRTKVYLEQMMRKKSVMALDSRYVTQIENAYYYVNPPELLYQDLQKNNTDKIMRLMRKLDWNNINLSNYAIKCLMGAHNLKYFNIRCLANLLAGLVAYQEEVGTKVVDGVLEDIRLGMEVNLPKFNQRRVAQVKYLGELYNYRMVESADVFKKRNLGLQSLLQLGMKILFSSAYIHRTHMFLDRLYMQYSYIASILSRRKIEQEWGAKPHVLLLYTLSYISEIVGAIFSNMFWHFNGSQRTIGLDPPNHLFRIRLACVLLETCGTYFSSGSSKRKLDYYLTFLQAYYWFKKNLWKEAFPPILEHIFKDTLTTLRPKLKLCQSYEDALEEVNNIRTTLGVEELLEVDNKVTEEEGLDTIAEIDNEGGDDEISEGVTGPITDDTATEDETVDHTQGSDDEGEPMTSEAELEPVSETLAIPKGPKRMECQEDSDFLSALDKMTYEQLQETPSETEPDKIGFVLMVRKGNKQQYKQFEADIDSELAQNLRDQEQAQREEKEKVKRLTLNITERFEEEDYQEMIQQQNRPATQNLNRERKKISTSQRCS